MPARSGPGTLPHRSQSWRAGAWKPGSRKRTGAGRGVREARAGRGARGSEGPRAEEAEGQKTHQN